MSIPLAAAPGHWSRALLFALLGVLASANARAPVILGDIAANGFAVSAIRLFGVSAVLWFAGYAMIALAIRDQGGRAASAKDAAVAAMLFMAAVLPIALLSAAALLVAACWLTWSSRSGSTDRSVGLIMLGLATHLVFAPLALTVFGPPILAIDSYFAGLFTGTEVENNVIGFRGAPGGYIIFGGCSSVGNMSLGLLLWVTLMQLFPVRFDRRMFAYFMVSMTTLFAINTVRLVSFSYFPEHMDEIHHGSIAALFAWGSLAAMAIIAGAGIIDGAQRQRKNGAAHAGK